MGYVNFGVLTRVVSRGEKDNTSKMYEESDEDVLGVLACAQKVIDSNESFG